MLGPLLLLLTLGCNRVSQGDDCFLRSVSLRDTTQPAGLHPLSADDARAAIAGAWSGTVYSSSQTLDGLPVRVTLQTPASEVIYGCDGAPDEIQPYYIFDVNAAIDIGDGALVLEAPTSTRVNPERWFVHASDIPPAAVTETTPTEVPDAAIDVGWSYALTPDDGRVELSWRIPLSSLPDTAEIADTGAGDHRRITEQLAAFSLSRATGR